MAHHIYTTDALIIESSPAGEADRFFLLFTRDLGVVRAMAKGVRLQKSKLRASLQDFSLSKVSLVRGKDIWRLTNARLEYSYYADVKDHKPVLHVIAQICALIKRLVGGEEKNQELFNIVDDAFGFLKTKTYSPEALKSIEIITVLRILHNLGYLRQVPELMTYIGSGWDPQLLETMKSHKDLALREINSSLRETQL
jgi:DNA repair protein RecO